MSQAPQVSIIVPLYNRVDLIGETINSVLKQTFNNWELIIVDDGSTDGSYEYIISLSEKESRMKLCNNTAITILSFFQFSTLRKRLVIARIFSFATFIKIISQVFY